jgi:hypothetical protein
MLPVFEYKAAESEIFFVCFSAGGGVNACFTAIYKFNKLQVQLFGCLREVFPELPVKKHKAGCFGSVI